MSEILEAKNLTIRFGGLTAADKVSFCIPEGAIHSIIGPNGAGKTTVFNAVTGIYPPNEGEVLLCGRSFHEPISLAELVRIISFAILAGLLAVVAVNAQSLWQAVIIDNFIYGQQFDWAKAGTSLFILMAFDWTSTVLPLFSAVLITIAAGLIWRKRSLHTPVSASERGVARTFQNIRLFQNMTALENVLVGCNKHYNTTWLGILLRLPSAKREEQGLIDKAHKLLKFVGVEEYANSAASSLPYGSQRRLEIARALATKPKVLLLDEPAAGMNPSELHDLIELIRKIRESGITVLLIEHHMKLVMKISDRITVLEYGRTIADDVPQKIQNNTRVIKAYLGEASDD